MKDTDVALTELLQNPDYNLPTILPDGVYTATMNLDYDTDSDDTETDSDDSDYDYKAPLQTGEEVCYGHNFNEFQCNRLGCCSFVRKTQTCISDIGSDICLPSRHGEDACEGHGFDQNQCESF